MFALVDCNSFYCSCERVFQPQLEGQPVIVLSNNDGCTIARTDEAKSLGIQMGDPFFKIKNLCQKNKVHVFSSNYALYGDMSKRIMQILSEYSPDMEVYSIDEAFLSFKGINQNHHTYSSLIQSTIKQCTGVPVSIGIGPTKVLAKVANQFAKKNKKITYGIFRMGLDKDSDQILKLFPAKDIWGIGTQSANKLAQLNIHTAYDLKYSNKTLIQKHLTIVGKRIAEELMGIEHLNLETDILPKKQILCSRSFGKLVTNKIELQEAIAHHITTASEKLRRQNCIAHSLMVFIHTNPFSQSLKYYNSVVINIESGSSHTARLIRLAQKGLEQIYRPGYEYKKAGIILMHLQSNTQPQQLNFFTEQDSEKSKKLMQTMDQINQQQGQGTLKYAACGTHQKWKMRAQMKSPNYTTKWSELLIAGPNKLKNE